MATQDWIELPVETGGGGGGITSINGATGPAITIAAGTGISIGTVGNTVTVTNTGGSGSGITELTGDVTAGPGSGSQVATIANSAVTNAKMANMADNTVKANKSGGSAAPSDVALGSLTETTSSVLTITGSNTVVGNTTIRVIQSSASASGYLSAADWISFDAKQAAGNYITALTGDGTATGPGSAAFTLATVNSNVGSFGSSTSIPSFTVNGKGLITAASGNVIIAPAGTLTGTTLAANVVTSSLTSVGTITSGTWNGTTIAVINGGTSLATLPTNNVLLGNGTSAPNFVAPGSSGNILTSNGTTWVSSAASVAGTTGKIAKFTSSTTVGDSIITESSGMIGIGVTPTSFLQTSDSSAKVASYTHALLTASETSSTGSVNKIGLSVQSTGTWNGSSSVNTGLVVNSTGGSTNYAALFSGGNVGIGTATPEVPLMISGTGTGSFAFGTTAMAQIRAPDDNTYLMIWRNSTFGTSGYFGNYMSNAGTFVIDSLDNGGNVATIMSMQYTGNIGLGLTAPVARLHIYNGHIKSTQGVDPSVTVSSNAGIGATGSVSNATDMAGIVELVTGSAVFSTGAQITVNFYVSHATAPIVVLTPHNATAGVNLGQVYVTSTTSGFTINFVVAALGTLTYNWNYHVIETN